MLDFIYPLAGYSLTAFVIALVLEPLYFGFATWLGLRTEIREESSDGRVASIFRALHGKKAGTPTGGGVIIWGSVLLTVLLSRGLSAIGVIDQSLLQRGEVYLPLFTLVAMGLLGGVDDYLNARGVGKKKGLEAAPKMFFLSSFALAGALWFYFKLDYTQVTLPLFGAVEIGLFAIPLYVFVIVGTANAVNITDGLDGLAGGLLMINFGVLATLAHLRGHDFLAIFCVAIAAALIAFLWHNVSPAKFFMGDSGSLGLGATLGVIAMQIDAVAVLPLIALPFVLEMLSVIIQLTSKKFRNGKKVFHIAPFHHHLEACGWPENQIVMRFWLLGVVSAIVGLLLGVIILQS